VIPCELPPFLDGACNTESFNLLVGAHEPIMMRRERRRAWVIIAATVALVFALISAGLARRTISWHRAAEAARSAHAQLLASSGISLDPKDPFTLTREIDRLRRTTEASALPVAASDGSIALAELLRAWPPSIEAQPKSIGIRSEGISLVLETPGDANKFLEAFRAPPGWNLGEPRLSNVRGITTLSLQLRPVQPQTGGRS
jgi:hypothetical protein